MSLERGRLRQVEPLLDATKIEDLFLHEPFALLWPGVSVSIPEERC